MFCDHVSRYAPGERLLLGGGFVVCPRCAAPCRGCDTPRMRSELDADGYCPECAAADEGIEQPQILKRSDK